MTHYIFFSLTITLQQSNTYMKDDLTNVEMYMYK